MYHETSVCSRPSKGVTKQRRKVNDNRESKIFGVAKRRDSKEKIKWEDNKALKQRKEYKCLSQGATPLQIQVYEIVQL